MLARRILLVLLTALAGTAQALVMEGVGHGTIHNEDIAAARTEARQAALRDLALRYEARVSTRETVKNGVITESHTQVETTGQARNIRVVDEQRRGNLLRLTVQAEMVERAKGAASCGAGEASRLRKRVAITGFPVLYPDQAQFGRIDDAGEILPQQLQARLREGGRLQVFGATTNSLFSDLLNAPTAQRGDNRLTNVLQVARELGVQFVVTGVIRDLGVADPSAWGTSVLGRMQRGLGTADQNRRFAMDLMVYDGFSGSPVFQQRFATTAKWDADPGAADGFGSGGFQNTAYGQAVDGLIGEMVDAVNGALACQPFMTRITRVDGNRVTLESGATAGLRPGDELHLYRSARYFDSLAGTPELTDAGLAVTLNNVHPDFSNGRMGSVGAQVNIQRDDIAIIW